MGGPRFRITCSLRNLDGLKAKVRADTRQRKEAVRRATIELGHEEFDLVQALANRDTNWMADHINLEFTRDGYNYVIIIRAEDFVGQENTNTDPPKLILFFYPLVVLYGGPHYAGNDFLSQARHRMRPRMRERYRIAVTTGR